MSPAPAPPSPANDDDDDELNLASLAAATGLEEGSAASAAVAAVMDVKDNERTYIARLILRIDECLGELGVSTDDDETMQRIEAMSILIHESMSTSSRNYHSVEHVFDISKDLKEPIAILAAVFHDCVYYNIDGGLSEIQAAKLEGVLLIESASNDEDDAKSPLGKTLVHPDAGSDDLLRLVILMYGYEIGQEVTPQKGLNEFLSAVIAVRELQPLLPLEVLAQIACCIEATIPFRGLTADGQKPLEALHSRFSSIVEEFKLDLTPTEVVKSVQRAAILSNEDVGNFGSDDRLWFLDNTWSLLPESNEALRQKYLYTVKEFQFAVFKMCGFFHFLKPTSIFHSYEGVPSNKDIEHLESNAERNLEVGRKYVSAKLLSISILAAFAELTGGDAPISLFMGDLPSRQRVSRRLEDTLKQKPTKEQLEHCDQDVYSILAHGRRKEMAFDVRQSPLAAYFYCHLGDEGLDQILKDVKVYPMNEDTARLLLTSLPREAVRHVAANMAKLATSRKLLIRRVVDDL